MATGEHDFDAFVAARTPALLRTAYLLTSDQHLAEDLVQTALAKASLRWSRIAPGAAEAYVRKAMYHEQVSWWRRRRVAESAGDTMPERGVADRTDAVDARLAMRAALARLGRRQRAVLVLRYFEDLTETQVADALGCSVGTVKSQTSKALARLRASAPELSAFGRNDLPNGTEEVRA
jgi:RNA polymerase sigma-70 factor (sigma-E family)